MAGLDTLSLPQVTLRGLGFGLAALLVALVVGQVARAVVSSAMRWRGRSEGSARVFGRLVSWLFVLLGLAALLTIVFPSVKPVNILGGVGVISIAAGIAFQTVLGNMFAGIVLLARDRFQKGDQIGVEGHRGTVVRMGLTSTSVRTFDGRLVIVPNGTLHSEVVTVQTGFEHVRSSVQVELADDADLERARRVAVQAMDGLSAVLDRPEPEAYLTTIGTATVGMELRFWSGSQQLETKAATHEVIVAVLSALRREGIQSGSDVVTIDAAPGLRELLARDDHDPAVPPDRRGPPAGNA
jgi:small-conductance mechanosensitive channel